MHRTAFGAVQVSIRHEMCWLTGSAVSGCFAPTAWYTTRCPAPAPRPQSLYFVGARLNSPRHDPKGSASPLHPGMQCGALPLRADYGGLSLRGAAEAIWQFSKEGLPRPLRGLAMTNGQEQALPLHADSGGLRRGNLMKWNQQPDSYTRGTRELIWQVTS